LDISLETRVALAISGNFFIARLRDPAAVEVF